MKAPWVAVGLLAALAPSGCATAPEPAREMREAAGAIRAAEELNARAYGRAAVYLGMARDALVRADALVSRGEMEEARFLLTRAKADAELASILTHLDRTKLEAAKVVRQAMIVEQLLERRAQQEENASVAAEGEP